MVTRYLADTLEEDKLQEFIGSMYLAPDAFMTFQDLLSSDSAELEYSASSARASWTPLTTKCAEMLLHLHKGEFDDRFRNVLSKQAGASFDEVVSEGKIAMRLEELQMEYDALKTPQNITDADPPASNNSQVVLGSGFV